MSNALSSCSVAIEIVSVVWSLLCGVERLVTGPEVFLHDDRGIRFSKFVTTITIHMQRILI